ncbi:hypothetical protein [Pasteurella multocida]|uniref:hypothetical protein n=1 Tax=Pasteurella multocida TaxID=747 RepID=UPI00292F2985|nr:hypothetical protein [Pasteurella multocida]
MAIVTNTPIWVWCVLLCLLYVGSKQSKTRQIKPYKLTFLPLIFLPIVIMSIMQSHHPLIAGFGFIVGLALGLFLGWIIWKDASLLLRQGQQWIQRGSYLPLILYLFIFIFRYVVGVAQHTQQTKTKTKTEFFNFIIGLPTGIGLGALFAILLFRQRPTTH